MLTVYMLVENLSSKAWKVRRIVGKEGTIATALVQSLMVNVTVCHM